MSTGHPGVDKDVLVLWTVSPLGSAFKALAKAKAAQKTPVKSQLLPGRAGGVSEFYVHEDTNDTSSDE
jgi:hypothetical protein